MNTVLLILGILGIGAILIAAYVFTVAARNYVSQTHPVAGTAKDKAAHRLYVVRSNQDRRQHTGRVNFPLALPSGEKLEYDRRDSGDRRLARAS